MVNVSSHEICVEYLRVKAVRRPLRTHPGECGKWWVGGKVKEPVFVPGTSCCTTISFSHFPHENVVFIVGFIGVCLVVPKSDCLTQVWVKEAPRGPV